MEHKIDVKGVAQIVIFLLRYIFMMFNQASFCIFLPFLSYTSTVTGTIPSILKLTFFC